MDPELKAALDELRRGIVTDLTAKIEAGDAEIRRRMATKDDLANLEQRMATKDDLANLEQRMADDLRALDAKVDTQGRDLRQGQADIIKRIDEGFKARKEDEDLALLEIEALRARVAVLEKRGR